MWPLFVKNTCYTKLLLFIGYCATLTRKQESNSEKLSDYFEVASTCSRFPEPLIAQVAKNKIAEGITQPNSY